MKHFLLFYEAGPHYLERRPQFRGAHLKHGERPGDHQLASLIGADPYVANGLVARWHVREWTTVVGDLAATPVLPESA